MRIQASPSPTGVGTERVLEVGKVKLPLPGWAVTALSALILLGACIYGGFWIADHIHSDEVRVSKKLAADLDEMQLHSGETPLRTVAWDDPDGKTTLSKFSDGCSNYRNEPKDRRLGAVNMFIRSPYKIAAVVTQRRHISLAGAAWAADAPPVRCVNPWTNHPGKFAWKWGEQYDGCRGDVIRTFEDGCEMAETMNKCTDPPTWSNARWLKCQGH